MRAARAWARARVELLDDPGADPVMVLASLGDITRVNRLLGGRRAALARLDEFLRELPAGTALTLLDVGAGLGDILLAVTRRAQERGLVLRTIALERHQAAARAARRGGLVACVADGARLPLRDRSVDVVLCSQLLHHFEGGAATRLVAELDRVARMGVVIADLRRSFLAAAGFYLLTFPMRCHPATRRDGVTSVLRAFTAGELRALCRGAGADAEVRRHAGFRLTAAWRPGRASP